MMNNTNKNEAFFKGVETYQECDKDKFYGRKVEVQQLLYKVEHCDWCVCYARSGEGKSSLINAGLIPSLREQQMFPINIRFGVDNDGYLQDVDFDDYIWKIIESYDDLFYTESFIFDSCQAISEKLWWKLRTKIFRTKTEGSIYNAVVPVLIFDQFEEVFTKPHNLQWTYNFFKWLEELYKDEIPANKYNETSLGISKQSFPKRFKALFSLRNEYVSELDYWSMERFFIPSLKNNRYYLKPLTITAAIEVTQQLTNWPPTINEDDVIKVATDDKYKFFEEIEEGKTENHPQGPSCVSALILSLVLSKLEESDEFVRQKLIEMTDKGKPTDNQKEFMEKLFDHIYEEALLHSGVGIKSSLRDRLEVELIDDNGRRKRPRIEDLEKEKDLAKAIEQLKEKRIVYINNGEVELSHDCIRATVARHRTQRLEQLERQRETAFLVPTLFFCLVVSMLGLMVLFDQTTILHLGNLYTHKLLWICEASNFIFIPLLIVACVKKVKATLWMSLGGSAYNLLLLILLWHIKSSSATNWVLDSWSATGIISFYTTITTFILTIYAWYYKKNFNSPFLKTIVNNIPYLIFLFFLLLFAFRQCIWGDFYSISLIPATSFWGIFILPPLGCYLSIKILTEGRILNDKKIFPKGKMHMLLYFMYIIILFVLAYDSAMSCHRILPLIVLLLIVCVFVYYVIFYFKQLSLRKRLFASIFNYTFFLWVYIANLGYCPLKISYHSAKYVFNWSLVYTLADNGKWGVIDAINGDTIIPCIMDREDFSIGGGFCDVKVKTYDKSTWSKSNTDLSPFDKTIDSLMMIINNQSPDGSYRYDCDNHVLVGRFWVFPKLESLLRSKEAIKVEKDTSIDSKIGLYSAKVYKEMRRANLQYLLSGKSYTIKDIPSFHKLDSLQFCNYESVLESTLGYSGAGDLTDTGFHQINKSLARTFLLCAIQDKISHQDLKSLFLMTTLYSYLYFAEDASWQMNYNGQFVLSPDGVTQTNFHISGIDFKDKAYSYYYMYLQTVNMDIYSSIPNLANMIRLLNEIEASFGVFLSDENLNQARKLSAIRPTMDVAQLFANVDTNNANKEDFKNALLQSIEKIRGYEKEQEKWKKDISHYAKQTKTRVDQLLADMNRLHVGYNTNVTFEKINEKTSEAFSSYIDRNPMSPYNMGFVRILQALCSSGFYRGYDMNENVKKVSALVEKNKDLTYQLMKDYGKYDNMMKERKENLENMSNLMQEIIEASQESKSK